MGDGMCSECGAVLIPSTRGPERVVCSTACRKLRRRRLAGSVGTRRGKDDPPRVCAVEGCEREYLAAGYCGLHYQRMKKGLPLTPDRLVADRGGRAQCQVDGCESVSSAKGYCPVHYERWKRHGDPLTVLTIRRPEWSKGDFHRFYKFGMDPEEFARIAAGQGGTCAICRRPERTKRLTAMVVDHDHVSGHVRGLLCSQCNRAIGLLGDDPQRIVNAARYVARTRQLPLPAIR